MVRLKLTVFLGCISVDKLEFLKHLKRLEGALVQLQPQIMKAIDTAPQVTRKMYMKLLKVMCGILYLPNQCPDSNMLTLG